MGTRSTLTCSIQAKLSNSPSQGSSCGSTTSMPAKVARSESMPLRTAMADSTTQQWTMSPTTCRCIDCHRKRNSTPTVCPLIANYVAISGLGITSHSRRRAPGPALRVYCCVLPGWVNVANELLVGKLVNTERATLPAIARFFDSTERHVFIDPRRMVDVDHAGLNLICDAAPALDITRID